WVSVVGLLGVVELGWVAQLDDCTIRADRGERGPRDSRRGGGVCGDHDAAAETVRAAGHSVVARRERAGVLDYGSAASVGRVRVNRPATLASVGLGSGSLT